MARECRFSEPLYVATVGEGDLVHRFHGRTSEESEGRCLVWSKFGEYAEVPDEIII